MVTIKLKKCLELNKFTECELQEIVKNLEICANDGCVSVYFSETPPQNRSLPWQETDDVGVIIGQIKFYSDGKWK